MKNTMTDLRNHLFAALENLTDPDENKVMPLDRAKAIADVAQVLVNSAKVEVDFIRALDGANVRPSGKFFPAIETVEAPPRTKPGEGPHIRRIHP